MMPVRLNIAAAPQWIVSVSSLLILSINPLYAGDLPDPTRPPASIFAPVAGAIREATASRSSGLHTIIISESRRAAIIDGQTVELWGEHRGARLIEVNEGSVVLQRAQNRQVLTMFPDVKLIRKESSPKNKSQVEQPSSASEAQSGNHQPVPTVPEEEK